MDAKENYLNLEDKIFANIFRNLWGFDLNDRTICKANLLFGQLPNCQ
jgi:hypothetical protein